MRCSTSARWLFDIVREGTCARGALLIRDRKDTDSDGPGLYVGAVFVRRQRRRDLAVPEGLDDRADLEARRLLCGPEHER